jgi:cephalosporin hydroxylase
MKNKLEVNNFPKIGIINKVKHLLFSDKKIIKYTSFPEDFDEFEINKWLISEFILKKIIPIVGHHPYPLDELILMIGSVCKFKPTYIFEWGTHVGKSARIFHETVKYFNLDSEIHSFDLPDNIDHIEHPKHTRGHYIKKIKSVKLYQEDGVLKSIEIYNNSFKKNKSSLFYLDGDHNYETVVTELERIVENIDNPIFLLHDTFFQSSESSYNIGPNQAIDNFLVTHSEYKLVTTQMGLPGMTLLYKKN